MSILVLIMANPALLWPILLFVGSVSCAIDRQAVVSRYNIIRTTLIGNNTTPLQVGNGNFAFNVDNTGMQTFLPFNTLSSWAWHNDSLPDDGEDIKDYHGVSMMTHGRNVSYDIPDSDLPEASQWLIGNPNRINLGRVGLKYKGATLSAGQISNPVQKLNVWDGVITSSFNIEGEAVTVSTQGDFESDSVAFRVESELVTSGVLEIELDFPYPPIHSTKYKYEVFVGVYDFPLNHSTAIVESEDVDEVHIHHQLQETSYFVNLRWPHEIPLTLSRNEPANSAAITAHRYTLSNAHKSANGTIEFSVNFAPESQRVELPAAIRRRNLEGWNQYWSRGGFVDVTSSPNAKADELQRRIILSLYHVRVNSAASGQSPQESGLMNNGWYGKFHMEQVLWHNAHWCTWGRTEHFDNMFPELYETFLPSSAARAKAMGWEGARWPKMTEISTGRSSPGGINGLLLWQQPHPMYLAELRYQISPTKETLERWDRALTATADYMASYAWFNQTSGRYDLGPPAYGVTENTPPAETLNLAYEIAYWRYGLDTAARWKQRLGQPIPTKWTDVAAKLASPPQVDGLYAVYEGLNGSWWEDPDLVDDPRSVIMLQGFLPDTPAVDPAVGLRTADKVAQIWTDDKIFGWGRPVLALNAAKIGNPERAVGYLTAYDYWVFDDAGFAQRGGNGGTPPPFMPGNAGFLYAVAYMAAGWQGSEGDAPGFPQDGTWIVKHEGLYKAL
ncbi:Six-hairpin glycosidase-like protein [Xylaria sp. FL1777]|nr:Six-hairpin glycosidase-like protein [Xylaria sp. FL1777]